MISRFMYGGPTQRSLATGTLTRSVPDPAVGRSTRHSPLGRIALYWIHTPMNRSDVIDPETKSRGAIPP